MPKDCSLGSCSENDSEVFGLGSSSWTHIALHIQQSSVYHSVAIMSINVGKIQFSPQVSDPWYGGFLFLKDE
jgi:hypothetical protein